MNNKPSISIIGSGVGGLFAGALLAKHGFKVNVFEARPQIGGYLTSWKRGDYLFESSMHELNGFYPDDLKLRTFRYLGIFDRVKFIPVSSPYTSVFKDGYKFTLPHNFDEYAEKLIQEFPEDKKEIIKVINKIKKMSSQVAGYLQEPDFLTSMKNTPVKYPMLIPGCFQTLAGLVKRIKNTKAKNILTQLFCYYSDNTNKMNILYFAMPTYSYFNESYYIKGTSAVFSNALADIIRENGGTVETNKKVTKILSEGDNLYDISNELDEYKDRYVISRIDGRDNTVTFLNGTVVKTSVGAISNIKIIRVANLTACINKLKKNGYWIVGTDMSGEDYTKINYNIPVCLVIGNEGKGMSKIVTDNCDFIATIPMTGKVNSLNASVSLAIVLAQIVNSRRI
jgi:phytoene dehydrogenase-like protein